MSFEKYYESQLNGVGVEFEKDKTKTEKWMPVYLFDTFNCLAKIDSHSKHIREIQFLLLYRTAI